MKNSRKFVIQKHTKGEAVHWDLMLEAGQVLETYRIDLPPEEISGKLVEAVKIFDHSVKFLTYQGSVEQGKGLVEIADSGIYRIISKTDAQTEFQFEGKILKGKFALTLLKEDRWQFKATSP